jgi:erythromycin esterase-like protein
MFRGRVSSWNLRDQHMSDTLDALFAHLLSDTLDALFAHLSHHEGDAKIVVWAHNSHLGDARATHDIGELNLGQLTCDRYGRDAVLIGFSTYSGTVTAASD